MSTDSGKVGWNYESGTPQEQAEFMMVLTQGQPKTPDQWIAYARRLLPGEYEEKRKSIAKRLNWRVSKLDEHIKESNSHSTDTSLRGSRQGGAIKFDDLEPWPEPVSGTILLHAIREIFNRYVILPDGAAVALALWVIHTYAIDAADVSPIIAVTSPEKRCGKTVVLELLQVLVRHALFASNITSAALFRTVERFSPTLLIDEADSFLKDNEQLRGVLNSGHRRAGAYIVRTTGDDYEPRTYCTWCPKAIALIGKLPDTIEDRSILIRMRRKTHMEKVERRHRTLSAATLDLKRQAMRWIADCSGLLTVADPKMSELLNDRAADCWRPLIAIADRVGGEWPHLARSAALAMSRDGDDSSNSVRLLADIRSIFETQGTERLSSESIIEELSRMEDRPWPEWKSGKPISKTQLAGILRRYGISPKGVRIGDKTPRGYDRSQFLDAFASYLDSQSATLQQTTPDVDFSQKSQCNSKSDVALQEAPKPAPALECCSVALQNGNSDDVERI